jgi:hypothetical protein
MTLFLAGVIWLELRPRREAAAHAASLQVPRTYRHSYSGMNTTLWLRANAATDIAR